MPPTYFPDRPCPGCVRAPSGLRLGSVWAPSWLRPGSVWAPSGLRLGSVWAPPAEPGRAGPEPGRSQNHGFWCLPETPFWCLFGALFGSFWRLPGSRLLRPLSRHLANVTGGGGRVAKPRLTSACAQSILGFLTPECRLQDVGLRFAVCFRIETVGEISHALVPS